MAQSNLAALPAWAFDGFVTIAEELPRTKNTGTVVPHSVFLKVSPVETPYHAGNPEAILAMLKKASKEAGCPIDAYTIKGEQSAGAQMVLTQHWGRGAIVFYTPRKPTAKKALKTIGRTW